MGTAFFSSRKLNQIVNFLLLSSCFFQILWNWIWILKFDWNFSFWIIWLIIVSWLKFDCYLMEIHFLILWLNSIVKWRVILNDWNRCLLMLMQLYFPMLMNYLKLINLLQYMNAVIVSTLVYLLHFHHLQFSRTCYPRFRFSHLMIWLIKGSWTPISLWGLGSKFLSPTMGCKTRFCASIEEHGTWKKSKLSIMSNINLGPHQKKIPRHSNCKTYIVIGGKFIRHSPKSIKSCKYKLFVQPNV